MKRSPKWQFQDIGTFQSGLKNLKSLIIDLVSLDVDEYLSTKPWREYNPQEKSKQRHGIMTEQISMMIIDKQFDSDQLGLMTGKSLVKQDEEKEGEGDEMESTGDYTCPYGQQLLLFCFF